MLDNTNDGTNEMLTRVFYSREESENAYNKILSNGYTKDDVSILMSDETRDKYFNNSSLTDLPETALGDKALEGMGVGSAIGGAVGGVAAAIAAIGTILAIPGLGLVIAGPIAAGLAGAGAGSIAGGLTGALVGSGISADRAAEYEEAVKNGGIVMGIKTRSQDDYASLDSSI